MKNATPTCVSGVDYRTITELAKAEILRLIALSTSLKGNGENPEIYRDWAYGAFLFWKSIAGTSATRSDVLKLEMLATGEATA